MTNGSSEKERNRSGIDRFSEHGQHNRPGQRNIGGMSGSEDSFYSEDQAYERGKKTGHGWYNGRPGYGASGASYQDYNYDNERLGEDAGHMSGSSYGNSSGGNSAGTYSEMNRRTGGRRDLDYPKGSGDGGGGNSYGGNQRENYPGNSGYGNSGQTTMQNFNRDGYGSAERSGRQPNFGGGYGTFGGGYGQSEYDSFGNAGQTGQHSGKGPKGYRRSPARIEEEVCEALTHDPHINCEHVEVSVDDKGEVTLTGTCESRRMKRMIEDCADRVSGVTDIRNELRVMGSERNASSQSSEHSAREHSAREHSAREHSAREQSAREPSAKEGTLQGTGNKKDEDDTSH